MSARNPDQKVYVYAVFSSLRLGKIGTPLKTPSTPRKQKIGVNKFWVRESEIGEECRQVWGVNLGVNFSGGPETMEKQGRKIRYPNSLSKFAGNFPKIRQTKLKNSPQIRSAEPRDLKTLSTILAEIVTK